ncbi:MAG: hypothetical protein JW863_18830 [Chitinispirillaceae bacterium]|nr:hypothetical protein [Chitinispirillaceae bacterium]
MWKKTFAYLQNNGIVLMVIGFLTSVVSFLIFFQTRFHGSATPRVAMGCAITGFVIYLIGRIFVATARHRSRKSYNSDAATEKDNG